MVIDINLVNKVNGVNKLKKDLVYVVLSVEFSLKGMFSSRLLNVILKISDGMIFDINSV